MIIAFDPSGNFVEGKGTTGIAFMHNSTGEVWKVDEIQATEFSSPEEYWDAHLVLLEDFQDPFGEQEVVMEGFRLYGHKAKTQTHSIFETPMLIGLIRHWCYMNRVPCTIQYAADVKTRWSDNVLSRKGVISGSGEDKTFKSKRKLIASGQILNNHKTDAIRHAMHYFRYTREKMTSGKPQ